MAKSKKLTFEEGEKLFLKGAAFQIVSIRSGNMLLRPTGGSDMEGSEMTLRHPELEKKSFKKPSDEAEE
jgi:hypothetical protein